MIRSAPILCLLLSGTAALSQARDHAPTALPYAKRMSYGGGESWNYRRQNLDLTRYRKIIIDQTVVYSGADAQFDGVERADRSKFAEITTRELTKEIGEALPLATAPGPDTLRLKMTLLGVDKTKGGVATATRVTPMGFALSAVKSLRGKEGTFTGSVLYALELTDSRSGELQIAAVRRVSPDALDIPATLSTSDTVRAVAEATAKRIRERLLVAMGR